MTNNTIADDDALAHIGDVLDQGVQPLYVESGGWEEIWWSGGVVEWRRSGGVVARWIGEVEEWGRVVEWWNVGVVRSWSGGIVAWWSGGLALLTPYYALLLKAKKRFY